MDYLITDILKYMQDAVTATCAYQLESIYILPDLDSPEKGYD